MIFQNLTNKSCICKHVFVSFAYFSVVLNRSLEKDKPVANISANLFKLFDFELKSLLKYCLTKDFFNFAYYFLLFNEAERGFHNYQFL